MLYVSLCLYPFAYVLNSFWDGLFSFLADEKVPVQSTNIPYHLEQMLDILRHEEDEQSGGTTVINIYNLIIIYFKFQNQTVREIFDLTFIYAASLNKGQ